MLPLQVVGFPDVSVPAQDHVPGSPAVSVKLIAPPWFTAGGTEGVMLIAPPVLVVPLVVDVPPVVVVPPEVITPPGGIGFAR